MPQVGTFSHPSLILFPSFYERIKPVPSVCLATRARDMPASLSTFTAGTLAHLPSGCVRDVDVVYAPVTWVNVDSARSHNVAWRSMEF